MSLASLSSPVAPKLVQVKSVTFFKKLFQQPKEMTQNKKWPDEMVWYGEKYSGWKTLYKTRPSKQCEFCIYLDKSFDQPGFFSQSDSIGSGGPSGQGGEGGQGGQMVQVIRLVRVVQVVRRSDGQVVKWSGGQMVR